MMIRLALSLLMVFIVMTGIARADITVLRPPV